MQRDLSPEGQQEWTMKEHDQGSAYKKRRRHATPPAPVCSSLFLTVFGHYSESISTLTKSKGQMEIAPIQAMMTRIWPRRYWLTSSVTW